MWGGALSCRIHSQPPTIHAAGHDGQKERKRGCAATNLTCGHPRRPRLVGGLLVSGSAAAPDLSFAPTAATLAATPFAATFTSPATNGTNPFMYYFEVLP